ncbi:type II toxin-antitoxin system Phd/YefM family antitoxin [Kribbella endophytica]
MSVGAMRFNMHEAKTQLSRIIERVELGDEIVIMRAGRPVAKVVPLRSTVRTGRGSLTGFSAAEDWDSAETNAEITRDFLPS